MCPHCIAAAASSALLLGASGSLLVTVRANLALVSAAILRRPLERKEA